MTTYLDSAIECVILAGKIPRPVPIGALGSMFDSSPTTPSFASLASAHHTPVSATTRATSCWCRSCLLGLCWFAKCCRKPKFVHNARDEQPISPGSAFRRESSGCSRLFPITRVYCYSTLYSRSCTAPWRQRQSKNRLHPGCLTRFCRQSRIPRARSRDGGECLTDTLQKGRMVSSECGS